MRIYVLFEKGTENVVVPGVELTTFRGEKCTLKGGKPPQHEASTGRIYTTLGEFFPSVCGLEWRRV